MLEQILCDSYTETVVSIIQRDWHVNPDCFLQGMKTNLHP